MGQRGILQKEGPRSKTKQAVDMCMGLWPMGPPNEGDIWFCSTGKQKTDYQKAIKRILALLLQFLSQAGGTAEFAWKLAVCIIVDTPDQCIIIFAPDFYMSKFHHRSVRFPRITIVLLKELHDIFWAARI